MSYYKDLTGKKIGRLTVICRDYSSEHGVFWKCICECGNYKSLPSNLLNEKSGSKSCGCLRKEFLETHGLSKTKLYKVWDTFNQRCYNPNDRNYKNYGARGINVCDEWRNNFKAFYDWSYTNGYKEEKLESGRNKWTIDRIDVNGDYSPENCRWVTMKEQCNNRRSNNFITIDGQTKTLANWGDKYNLKIGTIWSRIKRGKSGNDLIKPVKKTQRKE